MHQRGFLPRSFFLMPVFKRNKQVHILNWILISSHFVSFYLLLEDSSAHPSSVITQEMITLYPVMVLTCRRGIFHRTLKAEQLIVSSWMSNGGLRRSVSCKRKRETVDAGGEFGGFQKYLSLVWQQAKLNISRERSFYSRRESDSLLLPESWEVFVQNDESRGTALRLDQAWNYTSPSRQPCYSDIRWRKKNEVNRWKCFLTLQVLWWCVLGGLEWHFRRLSLGFQWPTSTWEPTDRINTDVGVKSSTPLMMT